MYRLENLCMFALVFTVLPFSLVQLEISLNQDHDIEAFTLWVFIAGILAGIPFMVSVIQ
jgi:hypothetical protein